MGAVLQFTLVILAPLAAIGTLVLMALGPFVAGLLIGLWAVVALVLMLLMRLAGAIHHWRLQHHWRVGHAPIR